MPSARFSHWGGSPPALVVRATPPSVPAQITSGSFGSMAMVWMSGCSRLPSTAGVMSNQVSPPSGLRMSTKIQL